MKLNDLCFEIIRACPNNCLFCSSSSTSYESEMISYNLFCKTIDRFITLGGITELSISGGEPLLHPDLLAMINYVKSLNIKVILYTSGIYKSKDNYTSIPEELINTLKESALDKIIFNLQTIKEDNYNYLTGTKNFLPFVLESIAKARDADIATEIHFIPLKINKNDLEDILLLGVERVSLLRFIPQGRGFINAKELMLSGYELQRFMEKTYCYQGIRKGVHLQEKDTHKCSAGLGKYLIRSDGHILPCAAFKDTDYVLANINDTNFTLKFSNNTRVKPLCKELKRF